MGALLFIIYIDTEVLENCEIALHANDTLILTEAVTEELCYENLDKDIDNINKWLKINKLKLNGKKIKLMEINMNTDKLIKINNVII